MAAQHCGWATTDIAGVARCQQHKLAAGLHAHGVAGVGDLGERLGDGTRWRRRAPIYNLYHLLNHLNLFGTGYLSGVRAVLRISMSDM
ncbi:MAG: fructosamine kinase family protein [Rhodanobacteraceae bacterium]